MKEITDNQLTKWYNEYNAELFGGSVAGYTVVAYKHLATRLGLCDDEKRIIQVDRTLDEQHARATLLHEIVHAFVGCNHGHDKAFNTECQRIETATGLNLREYRMTAQVRNEHKQRVNDARTQEYNNLRNDLIMWRERGEMAKVHKRLNTLHCTCITKTQQKKLWQEFGQQAPKD